jgi:hypothetical protein
MNANAWALPKDRALRRLLVAFDEALGEACDIEPDAGTDPAILTLRHAELESLRAHVFLHGQRPGTYGVYYEYPNPLPDTPASAENLPLAHVLAGLRMHFDA